MKDARQKMQRSLLCLWTEARLHNAVNGLQELARAGAHGPDAGPLQKSEVYGMRIPSQLQNSRFFTREDAAAPESEDPRPRDQFSLFYPSPPSSEDQCAKLLGPSAGVVPGLRNC